jgi:hypothetical protein
MDEIERAAISDEGYDPAVIAALARVSVVLAELGTGSIPVPRTRVCAGQYVCLELLANAHAITMQWRSSQFSTGSYYMELSSNIGADLRHDDYRLCQTYRKPLSLRSQYATKGASPAPR